MNSYAEKMAVGARSSAGWRLCVSIVFVVTCGWSLAGCSKVYSEYYDYAVSTYHLSDGTVVSARLAGSVTEFDSGGTSMYRRANPYRLFVALQPSDDSQYRLVRAELTGEQDGKTWNPGIREPEFPYKDSVAIYAGSEGIAIPYQNYKVRVQIEITSKGSRTVETAVFDLLTSYSERESFALIDLILSA